MPAVALLLAGSVLGCDDPSDPSANEVAEVLIVGLNRSVLVGQSIQFEGRAVTNSAERVDELVTWSVSAPNIVDVSAQLITASNGSVVNQATVTGRAAGGVDLIARAGTKSHSVRISVTAPLPGG